MRNYTLNIRLAAVLVAPLFLACGSDNQGGGTTYASVPDCSGGTNQVLGTDSTGQLVCRTLPAGAAGLPGCKLNSEALTSDGIQTLCDNLNTVDATTQMQLDTLTTVEQKIIDAGTQLTKLGTAGAAQASYVGLTTQTVTGRITSGTLVGIPAATAICAKQFGSGAHMCTPYEIYYSAALLKAPLTATDDILGGWAYMQSWRTKQANPTERDAGLADNCAGYTYTFTTGGTDANKWDGTTFVWANDSSSVHVPKFYANTTCDTLQPIACCR